MKLCCYAVAKLFIRFACEIQNRVMVMYDGDVRRSSTYDLLLDMSSLSNPPTFFLACFVFEGDWITGSPPL